MDVNSLSAIPVQAPTVRCYHCHFKFPDSCEILDHMFDRHFKREISLLCRAPSQTGATYRSIHYGIQPSDISKGKVNFVEESLSLEVIEDKLKDVIATTDAKGNEETHTYYINPQLGNSPRRVKSPSPRNLSSEENCFVFPSPKIAKKQLGIGVNDSPILSTKSYSESLSPSHSVLSYESSNSTYLNNGSAKFLDTTVPRKNGAPPIMTNKDVPKVILNGHTVFDTPIDTTSNSQTPKAVGSNGSVPHGMSGAKESRARPTSLPVSLDSSNIGLTLSRPRSGTKDSVASGASSTSIGAFSAKSVDSFVLSEEDVSAYRETFDMLDTNNDGGITKKQLLDFLTRLGADIPESDINTMMELVDSDADEVISFDELLELMRVFHGVIDHSTTVAEEMRAAFRVFDKNNDGKITREELKITMVELGEKLTEEEIDAMLKDADLNKDGVIDYTEFVQMMSRRFSHSLDYTENGKFSPEQVADLRIAFNLLDKDKDGTITKDELKVVMTAFHQSVTDKELDEIFAKVDLDRNGRIDFKEFLTMLEDKMKVQCEDAEMRQAFKVFDRDNNGYIDCDELKSTMDDLGVKLSNKDVDSMMKEAGVGKSKRIYYEDFVKMMYGKLPTGTKPSVQFSKEQVTEFKVSFALFDKDGDGYICVKELQSVMQSLGQAPSEDMLKKMFNKVDTDGNGLIDFGEFVDILERKDAYKGQEKRGSDDSEMRAVFKAFDKDSNGYVDAKELKSTMQEIGLQLTDSDVHAMMKETGVKDGRIFYEDFVKMMYGRIGSSNPTEIEHSPRPSEPLTPTTALTTQQLAELQVAFSMFDKDGDGRITAIEMQSVMKSLGVHTSFEKVQQMLRNVDKDGNGTIEFNEFQELMETWFAKHNVSMLSHTPPDADSEALKAFNIFDKDGNGFIDQKELQYTMKKLGVVLTDEDTALMLKEADLDGDGLINFEEFQRLMAGDFTTTKKAAQTSKLQEYRDAFKVFDKDSDGYIDAKELSDVMTSLGIKYNQKQIKRMILKYDKKRVGKVSFHDFMAMMTRRRMSLALGQEDDTDIKNEREMRDSFKVFDLDGDGFITAAELKHAMKNLGEDLSDADVDSMIQEADLDGDGKINYEEFKKMMSSKQ